LVEVSVSTSSQAKGPTLGKLSQQKIVDALRRFGMRIPKERSGVRWRVIQLVASLLEVLDEPRRRPERSAASLSREELSEEVIAAVSSIADDESIVQLPRIAQT
jgi:hypothetical protein